MNNIQIGHIVLSSIVSREEYINRVSKTNRVNVITDQGTLFYECPLLFDVGNNETEGIYRNPIFPNSLEELGPPVLLLIPLGSTDPIVLGTIPTIENYVILDNEKQQKEFKDSDECTITTTKDPINGKMTISIFGKTVDSILDINLKGKKDSKFNLNVGTEININSENELNLNTESNFNLKVKNEEQQDEFAQLKYELGKGLEYIDEFENKIITNKDGVVIETKNVRIGKDETLGKILTDLMEAIKNIQLFHPQGPTIKKQPINWISEFKPILDRMNKFLDGQ